MIKLCKVTRLLEVLEVNKIKGTSATSLDLKVEAQESGTDDLIEATIVAIVYDDLPVVTIDGHGYWLYGSVKDDVKRLVLDYLREVEWCESNRETISGDIDSGRD